MSALLSRLQYKRLTGDCTAAGAVAGVTWRGKLGRAGANRQVAETTNGRTI